MGTVFQSASDAATQHRELFDEVVGGSKRRALAAMRRHLDSAVVDLTGIGPVIRDDP